MGWIFLFIGYTALLLASHNPSEGQVGKMVTGGIGGGGLSYVFFLFARMTNAEEITAAKKIVPITMSRIVYPLMLTIYRRT